MTDCQYPSVNKSAVSLKQVFDTVLEAVGGNYPSANALQYDDETSKRNRGVFADYRTPSSLLNQYKDQVPEFDFSAYDVSMQAVQTQKYKLVMEASEETLYQITGINQEKPISKEDNTDIYTMLKEKLNRRNENLDQMKRKNQQELNSDVRDNLEKMGYL
jgi:hypothetical protein